MADTIKNYQIRQKQDAAGNDWLVLHPETDASQVIYNTSTVGSELSSLSTSITSLGESVVTSVTEGTTAGAISVQKNGESTAVKVHGLSKVATSGSYNDLSNRPTIPTVNNATLTIQKNGTTIDTFTANSSTNKTVNISVPTGAAASKGVVTSVTTSSDLPTSGAVKTYVDNAIAGVTQFSYEVVTSLPATGVKGKIYLIAHTHSPADSNVAAGQSNSYDEYIWVDTKYEKIGSTDIDLSNYATKTYANTAATNARSGAVSDIVSGFTGNESAVFNFQNSDVQLGSGTSVDNYIEFVRSDSGDTLSLEWDKSTNGTSYALKLPHENATLATETYVTGLGYLTSSSLDGYVNSVTGTANTGVITNITKSGKVVTVTSKSLATTDPTASGTTLTAIATITQAKDGKITATKKTIQDASTSQKGVMKVGTGLTASSGTVGLATSGVTAGSYSAVTVDTYGRVTAGSQIIKVGTTANAAAPADLAVGGLYFMLLS